MKINIEIDTGAEKYGVATLKDIAGTLYLSIMDSEDARLGNTKINVDIKHEPNLVTVKYDLNNAVSEDLFRKVMNQITEMAVAVSK